MGTRTIEDRRERLAELTDDVIPRLESRVEELDDEIADAVADGREPNGLREERDRRRERLEMFENAVPVIEANLAEAARDRLSDRAADLLATVRKTAGGIAGEQPRHVARFAEHLGKAREALEAAARAQVRGRILARIAELLADAFDLDRPEIRDVPNPRSHDEVAEVVSWSPSDTLRSWDKRATGVSRTRRETPRDAMRAMAAIDVDVDAVGEAAELIDRLAKLTDDDDGEG